MRYAMYVSLFTFRNTLNKIEMEEVKHLMGQGVYLLCAESAANTHLIENKQELQILLNMITNRLSRYLAILDYSITPTGWHVLVRLKSHSTIMKNYLSGQDFKKKDAKRICANANEVISETIRLLRSHFTNITNIMRGRKGNGSKGVFRKYIFRNTEEAQSHIELIRNSGVNMEQPRKRYRANDNNYDEDGLIGKSKELLNSQAFHDGQKSIYALFGKCIKVFDSKGSWFGEVIRSTCRMYGIDLEGIFLD